MPEAAARAIVRSMPTPRVLVLYASTHGHTARIATHLADRLGTRDLDVDLVSLAEQSPTPHGYDLVVAGGSVHGGHHQHALLDWLIVNRAGLDPAHTALFSVSITAADEHEEARVTTQEYLDELRADVSPPPELTASFAGALQYHAYGVAMRSVMRLIARHQGLPTDPAIDVDLTDWAAVDAFVDRIAAVGTASAFDAAAR
jgi:menaquinone-dependent protoporphyrinogen oxidase